MDDSRGREARLKPEHADLYPGLTTDTWMPVETLLRHIATLLHSRRAEPDTIVGERLIREEHFEFRGDSDRPDGLPPALSRLSDASANPVKRPRS
jgi:hypothetical protein